MTIARRGFTLANGPDANQSPELVDVVSRLLVAFGQSRLPNDTDESNLVQRLTELANYFETNKQSSSTVAMRNRLRQPAGSRRLTDNEVAERLRARGIDPRHMPRYGR